MGRMKVYGGEWNIPDAPLIEDPFAAYYRTTKLEASTSVEPPVVHRTPTKRPCPTTDDECDVNDTPTQVQSP